MKKPLFLKLINEVENELTAYMQSRVHSLHSFTGNSYIKRDDELSFSMTGTKYRKYPSLLRYLKKGKYKKIGVIGSLNSNNILSLSQVLIENNFSFQLYLLKPNKNTISSSNAFLLKLLSPNIQLVKREEWKDVFDFAEKDCDFVIPEGCFLPQTIPSLMSLGRDIERNEVEHKHKYQKIFIDSGTGISAISLILYFSILNIEKEIHVLSCTENESSFFKKLEQMKKHLELKYHEKIPTVTKYYFHRPEVGKSFGSIQKRHLDFIKEFATKEGVFLDPIYTSKLFFFAKEFLRTNESKEKNLIIHSGGGTSLLGFSHYFKD